ncbi:MAG: hypothetical protein IPG44_13680 [Anaerolineales bacterium]|jgi:hypothetical protein|nr:hypothetical protein [Anaerolineales bacterium]
MDELKIGDRVEIHLDQKFGELAGWYGGVVTRIEPYSEHRSFHWVRLDAEAQAALKVIEISVFNPKHIRKAARS